MSLVYSSATRLTTRSSSPSTAMPCFILTQHNHDPLTLAEHDTKISITEHSTLIQRKIHNFFYYVSQQPNNRSTPHTHSRSSRCHLFDAPLQLTQLGLARALADVRQLVLSRQLLHHPRLDVTYLGSLQVLASLGVARELAKCVNRLPVWAIFF